MNLDFDKIFLNTRRTVLLSSRGIRQQQEMET
jgi:hypothetical protein